jgi:fibronectin type 3 domain-containing protein
VTFTATASLNEVIIQWITGSEIDVYCFRIYRSTDPDAVFHCVAEIPSQGNTTITTVYSYTDDNVWPGLTYYYKISDVSLDGTEIIHPNVISATPLMGDFVLVQNFPNPFNQETNIRFALPVPAHATLEIYDVNGRQVSRLVDDWLSAGLHEISWDATDGEGNSVPSGMYIYRLTAGDITTSGKMILMK